MKFSELRKRKLNKRLLFFFPILVMLQGLALGHNVRAYTGDFYPTSYTINNTHYESSYAIRAIASQAVLKDTYEVANGNIQYLWESEITLSTSFPANSGYYSQYSTVTLEMNYPTTVNVVQNGIIDYTSTDNYNVSMYAQSTNTGTKIIRGYFRISGKDKYITKASAYQFQLVRFKLITTTSNNVRPDIGFTNISSNLQFTDGESYQEIITNAINNSDSAEDIADILVNSELTLTQIRSIANALGIVNNHLTYIQEYAYAIYQILNEQYPTSASEALSDAQDNLESINQDIIDYSPPTVSDQQIISDGQSAYMSMQLEGDTDNLFWYLNWGVILSLVTLIFSLAIISYIIYGKYS